MPAIGLGGHTALGGQPPISRVNNGADHYS